MAKSSDYNLVIVESPTKAKTIEKFLGDKYVVKSSQGHIRDLKKNNFGVDVEHNYMPQYIIPDDKEAIVNELKKLSSKASCVWLASDEDREGEAISWHLSEVLGLDPATTKRIVFHEITQKAILKAIETPRHINMNLVNAQQARRVLDRLVGFELSPVLWRKVKPSLSAGRVQSVAVRILVEREREIIAFESKSSYVVTAIFTAQSPDGRSHELKAELTRRFATADEVQAFLEKCVTARFTVSSVEKKPLTKSPAAPFTTSTLQQEAGRKLGFSVSQTMQVAQKLYEDGKITYMRTDSVNLAEAALEMASAKITESMGAEYFKLRRYKTSSKGAQEAHEAIRPTDLAAEHISGTQAEQRLYDLIWKRTIASQMADAKLEKTTVVIALDKADEHFVSTGEVITFDGFLRVYIESSDNEAEDSDSDNGLMPKLVNGQQLTYRTIGSRQRWTQHPPRYSEPSLVRRLEELGIGRPSTYAPTIKTIQQRGYVVKENREGKPRVYHCFELNGGVIAQTDRTETCGAEKGKLFPTDIGMVVNDFLLAHFTDVMSFDFTANVEKQFDDIAEGTLEWQSVIDRFYKPFHHRVEDTMENSQKNSGERSLAPAPATGKPVSVRIGRFGPMVQIGESDNEAEKPRFAALRHGQYLETITLEEALRLFELPRHIGEFEGKEVVIGVGRFGPYIRHDGKFVSLRKGEDDPYTIDLETAVTRIADKREADLRKQIKLFDNDENMKIINGRWGPYISFNGENYKIPKDVEAEKLTYDECLEICKSQPSKAKKATTARKTVAAKETAAKPKPAAVKAKTKAAAKPAAAKKAKTKG